jgi:ketosteroid isomerase-like protein
MDVAGWLEAYRVAWERRDPDAAAALFADGSTYRANIFEEPFEGPDGVRRYWTDVTASQADVEVRIGHPYVDGDRVAAEFWTNMRVAGDEVTLPGCLLLRFADDGRCASLHEYWHFEPGRLDPPPEWGS